MTTRPVFTLQILPGQLTIHAPAYAHLHEILDQHGIALTAHCDGMGLCGKCRVRITCADGRAPEPTPADLRALSPDDLARGLRLACMWRVCCDAHIEIPASSRMADVRILASANATPAAALPDTPSRCPYGIAVDIGTTTVVGALLDLRTGDTRAVEGRVNAQRVYGADVISRINHALHDGGAAELHLALASTINAIITTLLNNAHVAAGDVGEIILTGNSVMLHSLHRAPMHSLATLPFEPAFLEARTVPATQLGLALPAQAQAYSFPLIGGFVGGDTVACMLATGMDEASECHMIIDIGTNGEVALGCKRGWTATSAPAGPAFEGARISCGMPGAAGAIEHVIITPERIELDVIGEQTPRGICGTGLIDITAALLDWQILDTSGRLCAGDELPPRVPDWLRARVVPHNGDLAFLLFDPAQDEFIDSNGDAQPLHLTQRDFRELQLAKAAVAVACQLLVQRAGLTYDDVAAVYLAGAFGNYLRPATARRIGLLPNIPLEKIIFIGNAASTGARAALVSRRHRKRAEALAKHANHIDLAADPAFQMAYAEHMLFPELL